MNTFLILVPYLIGLLENISCMIFIFLTFLTILAITYTVCTSFEGHPNGFLKFIRTTRWFQALLGVLLLFSVLLPSKSTVYQMVGIWGGIEIAQSESVQRIAPKTLEVLESMMEEYLVDTNKAKEIGE